MLQERRLVTVLFADLVDYSSIALTEDPEDLRELLTCYYTLARTIVEAEGGIVAEYLADGVVAHFGIAPARPDAADRAFRAARQISLDTSTLACGGRQMAVRIGLASGLVVAEFDDGTRSRITGAAGLVAARLQALAEPGGILISDLTRRLLQKAVPLRLRPVPFLNIDRVSRPAWSFAPLEPLLPQRGSLPFQGRKAELARLGSLWAEMVRTGHSTPLVLLSGERGVGKSRILDEHARQCCARVISLQTSERHRNCALHPLAEWLRREGEPGAGSPEQACRDALSCPDSEVRFKRRETTAAIRHWTFAAIAALFRRRAAEGPLLVTIEDLHWADRSTLDLIGWLQRQLRSLPIQWLATARPEFATKSGLPSMLLMPLDRLTPEDCRRAIAGGALPAPVARRIVSRSEGVPLYLEHLFREAAEGHGGAPEKVPDTLLDRLLAWIDGTGPARRIVQHAAVIGRQFDTPLLAAALEMPCNTLEAGLARLCHVGIFERGPNATYAFRHALIRDAALGTLLRQPRQEIQRRIAVYQASQNPRGSGHLESEPATSALPVKNYDEPSSAGSAFVST